MADVTIAAAVKAGDGTSISIVRLGETTAIGDLAYLKASDTRHWLAINTAEATAEIKGVFLTGGSAGDYAVLATAGDVEIGTVAVGEIYTASSTAGKIHPDTDLATTEWVSILGYGKTAAILTVAIVNTGIQHA